MARIGGIRSGRGDEGETAIGDGSRVSKTNAYVEACGALDELNCALGILGAKLNAKSLRLVRSIQNDLFDLGADLCVPLKCKRRQKQQLRLSTAYSERLEREIVRLTSMASSAGGFVLPGAGETCARAHLARAICRRAERRVWSLAGVARINPEIPRYLNCLSDLLFAFSRVLGEKRRLVAWRPQASLRERQGKRR